MLKILKIAIISAVFLLSGCKVSKQVNTSKNETQSENKVDSSSQVKADITKENRIETVITEEIDTTIFVNKFGEIATGNVSHLGLTTGKVISSDTIPGVKWFPIHIKKKKTTKKTEDIKEIDKSKTTVEVKKKEETKTESKTVVKDVKKSSLGLWWLIPVIILACYLCWRFYIRKL